MDCPFCGVKMDEGFVSCPGSRTIYDDDLRWLDRDDDKKTLERLFQKYRRLYSQEYTGAGLFGEGIAKIPAHKCDSCKKVILETYVVD